MASPGTLIKPTSVAAVSCHAVSPGFSQLGLGTRPSRYISEFPLEEITCPQARISSNAHRRRPAQTWCACTDGHALLSVHLRRTRRDADKKRPGPGPALRAKGSVDQAVATGANLASHVRSGAAPPG